MGIALKEATEEMLTMLPFVLTKCGMASWVRTMAARTLTSISLSKTSIVVEAIGVGILRPALLT